ncbi:hypothetical protein EGY51_02090, partial [Salmonella enterica]|nr:hypothetical protein [Salmonella enterica]
TRLQIPVTSLYFFVQKQDKRNNLLFYKLITPNEWDRRLVSGQDHFPLRVIFLHCQSEGAHRRAFVFMNGTHKFFQLC